MAWPALLAAVDRAILQGDLGGTVRYTPSAGAPVDVRGIFDAAYVRVGAGGAGAVSQGPAAFVRLADLPTDPEDDPDPIVTVEEPVGVFTPYSVREVHRDGQGGAVLDLDRREA